MATAGVGEFLRTSLVDFGGQEGLNSTYENRNDMQVLVCIRI